MRTSLYILSAVAGSAVVNAAGIPGLPPCTANCISTGFGGCSTIDAKCICSNTSLISNLACCISAVCSKADQDATLQFAQGICAGQSVTNLPQSATCSAGQTPSLIAGATTTLSSSGSASATATTTAASQGTSSTASSSGTLATTGSSSSGSTGVVASATSAAQSSATSAAATTGASGSANKLEAAAFGLGALIFGALAAM